MKKVTFNVRRHQAPTVQITGYAFDYQAIQLAVHGALRVVEPIVPDKKYGYEVTEITTGLYLVQAAKTIKEAIAKAQALIDRFGVDHVQQIIANKLLEKP